MGSAEGESFNTRNSPEYHRQYILKLHLSDDPSLMVKLTGFFALGSLYGPFLF